MAFALICNLLSLVLTLTILEFSVMIDPVNVPVLTPVSFNVKLEIKSLVLVLNEIFSV